MPEEMDSSVLLSGDPPKLKLDEDVFGFKEIAQALAEVVRSRVSADGYAIGIEGQWGSGKTTLLNFVREILQKDQLVPHPVIIFQPWLVGTKESLLRALFSELLVKISSLRTTPSLERSLVSGNANIADRLIDNIERYVSYLNIAATVTSVAVPLDPSGATGAGAVALKALSSIAKLIKKRPPTLEFLKGQIVDDLRVLEKLVPGIRITILIDDTDRLDAGESIEILRLIKAVANFPLLKYIVCFDREILSRQVCEITKVDDGEKYLEKIFQQIVSVPPQEPFALRRFIRERLTQVFPQDMVRPPPEDPEFSTRKDVLFDRWMRKFITTPRDAIRLCEAVKLGWPYLQGRGDVLDYIWLQLIKL